MRPPARVTRTPKVDLAGELAAKKAAAAAPKRKRIPKVHKEGVWKPKEKKDLLAAILKIERPNLPQDLAKLQRSVPTRSIAEIETLLDDILKPHRLRSSQKQSEFSESYAKKWIDCCDAHAAGTTSQVTSAVSAQGDGKLTSPHPAMSLSSVFEQYAQQQDSVLTFGSGSNSQPLNYYKIYSFIKDIIDGKDPFIGWAGDNTLESAILLEITADITHMASTAKFTEQAQLIWDKNQEVKAENLSTNAGSEQVPHNIYESTDLNPLRMSESLTQSIISESMVEGPRPTWYKYA